MVKQKYFYSGSSAYSPEVLKESLAENLVLLNDLMAVPGADEALSAEFKSISDAQLAVLHFLNEAEFVAVDMDEEEIEKRLTVNRKSK